MAKNPYLSTRNPSTEPQDDSGGTGHGRNNKEVVALRYDSQNDAAPRVLAKGRGAIADRILALASEHNIPLYEDQDLVQLLGVLDINAEIPAPLYTALAEVLAHIYRANNTLGEKVQQAQTTADNGT